MSDKSSTNLRFMPAVDYNDAQALLINEASANSKASMNIIAIINCCEWRIGFRIFCDDIDTGDKILDPSQMCLFSFSVAAPDETLVFCQTLGLNRTMNFDAWGGTAPRGLNVWSLLPSLQDGLALCGLLVKKGWTPVGYTGTSIEEEDEDDSDQDSDEAGNRYFHKSTDLKSPVPGSCTSPAQNGFPDAFVPNRSFDPGTQI
ncbi:uncharacterized protein LOC129599186 [Paramacrobiotus metropolitanus]|uniref:uncharacterized protein LOC129599186 n=1 Tax=Paramacrobiotus metropolitanus TaxID=2943436 RepID=UPI002446443A|nr:uncharacterized protein LOC129599186 [Paramacrobiotus metropolitanus]